jgi:peptide/nickel transport system substrate-binding protein
VKFHNGDEVTSADVKFSLERFTSQKSRSGSAQVLRSTIDHIDTPDPYTVSVTTKDVNVRFIYSVSTLETGEGAVMPKKYIEEKGEEYFAKHPVGAGPWKFVKYEPASTLELEAVEGHYRNTPAFEKLVIKLVPEETTRVAMLKRGEADIADISVDRVNEVKSAGLDVREVSLGSQPALLFSGTWMNTGQPTMDLRVRQALAYAINREEIAKQFFQGYATPAIRFKMFPVSFGWNPEWKPIPYDPNKAKALLAEAGYPDRFKDPVINMFSYKQPGAEWLPKYVEIISGYWEAVGVKTKITPMEFGAFRPMYLAKPPDPKIVGGVWFFNVPTGFETISAIEPFYSSTGSVGLLRDPEWDALAAKAAKELDEGKRVELVRQMVDRAHEQRVDILTVSVMRLYAVGNNVGPWTVFGMGQLGKLYETVKHK